MRYFLLLLFLISIKLFPQSPYDVHPKASEIKLTEEQIFIQKNFITIPMYKWEKGMKFLVMPDEYSEKLELNKHNTKYDFLTELTGGLDRKEFEWKIFEFIEFEIRKIKYPKGIFDFTFLIFECEGKKYEFKSILNLDKLKNENEFHIEDLIYLGDIDKAKSLLLDKELYILTNMWMDESRKFVEEPKKYIKVKIVDIGVDKLSDFGNTKFIFKTERGNEFSVNVVLSYTNTIFTFDVVNKTKITISENKRFDKIFSFKNPHLKYPLIKNEVWEMIQQNKVKVGMTEEECILSWGNPNKINESSHGSDQWVYSGGYLYFENSKLVAFN